MDGAAQRYQVRKMSCQNLHLTPNVQYAYSSHCFIYITHHVVEENLLNALTPQGDWHLISPYNITPESNNKVKRIKEIIIN